MISAGEPRQLDWLGKAAETPDAADAARPTPRWLGLITDHRRLFDALQDGWLHPRAPNAGLLTRIGAYADDPDAVRPGHPIPVRIKLDAEKLPALDVSVLRGSQWMHSPLDAAESSDIAVYWPGSLPVFAISELVVGKEEERARLKGMARELSNVELPDVPVTVQVAPESATLAGDDIPPIPPVSNTSKLDVPAEVDPLHGAMSMAVWAVPRIDPWLDVLVASLSSDHERLPELTANIDAGWWRFPPWTSPANNTQPRDFQDRLWLAAVDVLRRRSIDGFAPPRVLAEHIADAVHPGSSSDEASACDWLRTTQGILRAESVIEIDGWRACPVGKAVQLVLTRPEPTRFKTWHQDLPSLPPAVWWSAAVLCGLHHGYRKLDIRFRGTVEQRALIAVHALRACVEAGIRWPALSGKPRWRRAAGGFELLWGDRTIAHKPDKAHGKWYAASFDDAKVRDSAMRVARDLEWSCCWSRRLDLPKGSRMPFAGSMTIRDEESHGREPAATRPPAALADMSRTPPTGEVYVQETTTIQLPPGHTIEEVFDIESFRRQVSVTGARLPEPPQAGVPGRAVERLRVAEVPGPGHVYPRQSHTPVPATLDVVEIPGLRYVRDFLDEADEKSIISEIDRGDWIKDLRRRVQHYGWRYDYKARRVNPEMRLGALPAWADALARRLFDAKLVPNLPDQVIVNEYVKDQGIGKHVDSGSFADGIAMISLLESWEMIFCDRQGKRKVNHMLERRSVAVIEGEARYDWTHEIPKRKSEPVEPGTKRPRRARGRRVSLTFRKVLDGDQ